MGAATKIEWATHTFSPWIGCQKVSAACDFCYAEAWDNRFGGEHWGPHAERRRTSPANWQQPLKWNREAERTGTRPRVFCASLADVFDNRVPAEWRHDLWDMILTTRSLDWLLLTKRPQNIAKMLPGPAIGTREWGRGWPNVWLGTTAENQEEADRRIPVLLSVPAAKRFLSAEPLLGPVDLSCVPRPTTRPQPADDLSDGVDPLRHIRGHLDWVIAGGESGPNARPMHPDWARSLRDQCAAAGVPFFFKQFGTWAPDQGPPGRGRDRIMDGDARCAVWTSSGWTFHRNGYEPDVDAGDGQWVFRLGKAAAGRLLDGREWNEVPA